MGRVRSARALQLLKALAGERLAGVKQACAGGNIWSVFFEQRERSRRDGSQGGRKARAAACWSAPSAAAACCEGGGELPWVDGSACASDAAVITLRSLISPPLSVSYTFTMLVRLLK